MDNKTILLVEGNSDDEMLILRTFGENNIRNEVVVVRDGAQALDYLFGMDALVGKEPGQIPELMLLDLSLPKDGGVELLKRIRSMEQTRLLPVVVFTDSAEEQIRISGYEFGAQGFVQKPIEFDKFVAAVRQLGLCWLLLNQSESMHSL